MTITILPLLAVEWEFDSLAAYKFSQDYDDSTALFDALMDAGGNWTELRDAVTGVAPQYSDDVIWLLSGMTHLDRLLMQSDILVEHVEYAYKIKDEARYSVPDSMFRDYILAYRISYEPVTHWRKLLYDFFMPRVMVYDDVRDVASIVNGWIADSIAEGDYNLFGGMQSPDMTLKRRKGTPSEISALTTAALKALGIPTRSVYLVARGQQPGGKSWVEFYTPDGWLPLYPDTPEELGNFGYIEDGKPKNATHVFSRSGWDIEDVTANYTETGKLIVKFFIGESAVPEFGDFSVQVPSGGSLVPLDYIGAEADSLGIFEKNLGNGFYYLTWGQRDKLGNPTVELIPFEIKVGQETQLDIDVTPQITADFTDVERGQWGDVRLPGRDGKLRGIPLNQKKPTLLLIYDPEAEPSQRAMDMLNEAKEKLAEKLHLSAICTGPIDSDTPEFTTIFDTECTLARPIGNTICDDYSQEMPHILYFPVMEGDRSYEILSQGYDLNIISTIEKRLMEDE